jgi:hypothetical protein
MSMINTICRIFKMSEFSGPLSTCTRQDMNVITRYTAVRWLVNDTQNLREYVKMLILLSTEHDATMD